MEQIRAAQNFKISQKRGVDNDLKVRKVSASADSPTDSLTANLPVRICKCAIWLHPSFNLEG